jgi:predicted MFS family arabinose efflux permease
VNISISSLDRADALNQRDFRQYVGSTFVATIAMMIQSVAVAWQVYDLVRNPLALGYVGLFQFLPLAIFALPAGELADRIDRRAMLAISYGVQTVCAILFLAMTVARPPGIWPFYAVLALFGSARAFAAPASQALLPRLVSEESFPRAVALTSSTRQTAVILGPAIGGAIYILGPAVAYGACAVLLIGVTALVATLRTQNVPVAHHSDSGPLRRVMAGIAFIRRKPVVLGAISLDLFAVLLGGATALLPIYARDILHVGPVGLGLLRSAPALGAATLGLNLARRPLGQNVGRTMFACVASFGLATIVFGLSRNFALSLGALVVLGASDMVSVYVRLSLVQLATPDAMRGRVSAVNYLFIGASNELGEFESGVTAAWFGTVPSVVIGGIGTLVVVGLWMLMFPDLRKVNRLSDVISP